MNEFDKALAKTDKREQRKTLHLPSAPEPVVIVPKEKRPSIDAVITVTVELPYERFELSFTKANVVGMRKLSKNDFKKAISEGLSSILGAVR
jgi:hypothetical protein